MHDLRRSIMIPSTEDYAGYPRATLTDFNLGSRRPCLPSICIMSLDRPTGAD
jgi:hypothetical protein